MPLPVVPLIWLAIWAARAMGRAGKGSAGGEGPGSGPSVQRALSLPFHFTNFVRLWTLLAWPAALALLLEPSDPHFASYVLLNLALATFNLPRLSAPLAARLLPPKLAFYIVDLLMPRWAITSSRAGAALTLLRVHAARGPVNPMLLAWLEIKLERELQPAPLSLVAFGAIALCGGRRADGEALLRAVATLPRVPGRDPARAIAMDWCMAEALERGDALGAVRIGLTRAWGSTTPPPSRGRLIASVLLGALDHTSGGLLPRPLMWAYYPRLSLRLEPLIARLEQDLPRLDQPLERARAQHIEALAELLPAWARSREARLGIGLPPARSARPAVDPLRAHRDLLARRHPLAEEVHAVAAAWDHAPADPEALRARLETLRCPRSAEELLDAQRRDVASDLAEILVEHRLAPAPGGPTLEAAREIALERLRPGIEDLVREIQDEDRAEQLYAPQLYALWQRLREGLELAIALSPAVDRRQIIQSTFGPILDFAAWAHNKRHQRLFARVMMLWLLELGEGVCAPRFMETVRKNTKLKI